MPRWNHTTRELALYRREWFDWRTAYQDCSSGVCSVVLSDGTPLIKAGVAATYAGGGVVCAQLDGLNEAGQPRGVMAASSLEQQTFWPEAGAGPVSPDGDYAIKLQYFSYGPWDIVRKDGSRYRLTDGDAHDVQLLEGGAALWTEGGRVQTMGLFPANVPDASVWNPRAVRWGGRDVVGYQRQADGAYVIDGRVVLAGGNYHYPDLGIFGDALFMTWAPTTADAVALVRSWTIEELVACPRVEDAPPAVLIPRVTHPMYLGWFEYDPTQRGPGSCTLAVRNIAGVEGRPVVLFDETVTTVTGQVLGQFLGGTVEQIEARSLTTRHRPIAYWDDDRWPRQPVLPRGSWQCVRAYCRASQSLGEFEAGVRSEIRRAGNIPIVLVGQQYTSNTTMRQEIRCLIPILMGICRDFPNVVMLALFNGYGRASGIGDHPEIVADWTEVAAATEVPAFVEWAREVPPTPPPTPPPAPRLYQAHKEKKIMEDTLGNLRGPSGKLARLGGKNTGPWAAQGWRGLVFDGGNDQKNDPRYQFLRPASKPNALLSTETGAIIGCDATKHSGGLNEQFYAKPDGDTGQGWAETFHFYDGNSNGAIMAVVEYGPGFGGDDGAFFSYALAFEAL